MNNAKCPACTKVIQLHKKTYLQELIICPNCNSLLELIAESPPTLDWAEDPVVFLTRGIINKMF